MLPLCDLSYFVFHADFAPTGSLASGDLNALVSRLHTDADWNGDSYDEEHFRQLVRIIQPSVRMLLADQLDHGKAECYF